jgi:hypothetical protein
MANTVKPIQAKAAAKIMSSAGMVSMTKFRRVTVAGPHTLSLGLANLRGLQRTRGYFASTREVPVSLAWPLWRLMHLLRRSGLVCWQAAAVLFLGGESSTPAVVSRGS